ncbi:thiamine phosphate synthase [Pelagibacterales bacterium SAG-MED47]|nr:thiamine phosphate synthase [Pelagibacterales bacterium SAG-MED47]
MRFNRKKFIYIISPLKIRKSFYNDLTKIFKLNRVSFFQLRLKRESFKKKLLIGRKVKKICKKFNVKFLINDDVNLVKKLNADGCHLGQKDMSIFKARKIIGNKIIGITCHNSIRLSKNASENGADYLALGAFYSSKTKKTKYKANLKLIKRIQKITKIPIVAIGGINFNNYKKLLLNKANFLAISGYIWSNKELKPIEAIKKLK